MKKLQLTPEQKIEYDALMKEIEEALEALPSTDGIYFSNAINEPYRKIAQKYQKRMLEIKKMNEHNNFL